MLGALILLLLVLWIVGGLPHWGYWGPNRPNGYGYGPSLIGIVVLLIVLFWLFGGGFGDLGLHRSWR